MLNLFHNEDGTGQVTEQNPLQTKHTNSGEAQTISAYIVNDGKRYGVDNDSNPPALIYSNISVRIEGVSYTLEESLTASTSDVTVKFTGVDGWNIGTIVKLGTERLRQATTPVSADYAAPGDLIFFEKTYDTTGASHVGIYVGNGMMIHAGNPVSYESIESNYWQSHFLGYGRIE